MPASGSLIAQLDAAIQYKHPDRRVEALRRITDLFLNGANQFDDKQMTLFDGVLLHLIKRVEGTAVAELSRRIAPLGNAPNDTIQCLARHADATVATPVLSLSPKLDDDDLAEIAGSHSNDHLVAISIRSRLTEKVTDVLVERGDQVVAQRLAHNCGASFSATGLTRLIDRATADEDVAEGLGRRTDIPQRVLERLLSNASEAVRARLMRLTPRVSCDVVNAIVTSASRAIIRETVAPRCYVRAQEVVQELQECGELTEGAIADFAASDQCEEVIVALSIRCSVRPALIERLLDDARHDGVLVACRAARLSWTTVSAILKQGLKRHVMSNQELDSLRQEYFRITEATAQRAMRFWQVRLVVRADG